MPPKARATAKGAAKAKAKAKAEVPAVDPPRALPWLEPGSPQSQFEEVFK